MERMTIHLCEGVTRCTKVSTDLCYAHENCFDCEQHKKMVDCLAAYEDTGLTPEQIVALKAELEDERYRHDRLQDFCMDQSDLLDEAKANSLPVRVGQFEIFCFKCGKWKSVRLDNFLTSYQWNGGSTLICPKCATGCNRITFRAQTIENMVREMSEHRNRRKEIYYVGQRRRVYYGKR